MSLSVLAELAKLLADNPWIAVVEIRVHENGGREPYGINLTRRRATRLRALLTERGVDAAMIVQRMLTRRSP